MLLCCLYQTTCAWLRDVVLVLNTWPYAAWIIPFCCNKLVQLAWSMLSVHPRRRWLDWGGMDVDGVMRDHTAWAATDLCLSKWLRQPLDMRQGICRKCQRHDARETTTHTDTPIWSLSLAYKHAYIDAISAHALTKPCRALNSAILHSVTHISGISKTTRQTAKTREREREGRNYCAS